MLLAREEYRLLEPVEFGGIEVTSLALATRVRGKHLKMAGMSLTDTPTWEEYIKLIAALSGQPDRLIEELCFSDLQMLVVMVGGFLAPSRPTGGSGSPSSPETSDSQPESS